MPKGVVIKKKQSKRTKNKPAPAKEVGAVGQLIRAIGRMGGGVAGTYLGAPVAGASIGHSLGASLSKWLGAGDYTVQANSIVRNTMKGSSSVPMMHRTDQSVTIRHREFIQTVEGGTPFSIRAALALNPGLSATFPWLSQIAANFQEYQFKGLVFHYVPTSGMATGADTRLGAVMAQTVYRATDQSPSTKYELLNEYWSNESMPSEAMAHPIECKPSETVMSHRYVRTGTVSDDLMFYDYGRTIVATQGQIQTGIIGDLWVTYEVELRKPKLTTTLGSNVKSVLFNNTGMTTLRPLNNSATEFTSFVGTISVDSPADNQLRVRVPVGNPGSYLWNISMSGTGLGATGSPSVAYTNTSAIQNTLEGNTLPTYATSASRLAFVCGFRVTDPTVLSEVLVSGITITGTLTRVTVTVTQLDADIPAV